MSDSLIIDARAQLRWHRRLFSDASTAMLWGAWLWLWRPVLSGMAWLIGSRGVGSPAMFKALAAGAPVSVEATAMALVSASGSLLVWNLLTNRTATTPDTAKLGDYARHFNLPEREIESGRSSSVCVVHHDDHGRIVRIESRCLNEEPMLLRSVA